jgi:hypothetical protein
MAQALTVASARWCHFTRMGEMGEGFAAGRMQMLLHPSGARSYSVLTRLLMRQMTVC